MTSSPALLKRALGRSPKVRTPLFRQLMGRYQRWVLFNTDVFCKPKVTATAPFHCSAVVLSERSHSLTANSRPSTYHQKIIIACTCLYLARLKRLTTCRVIFSQSIKPLPTVSITCLREMNDWSVYLRLNEAQWRWYLLGR